MAYPQTEAETTIFDFSQVPDETVLYVENDEVVGGVLNLSIPAKSDCFVVIFLPATDYALTMDLTFSAYSENATVLFFPFRYQEETFCSFDVVYDPTFGTAVAGPFTLDDCADWDITEETFDLPTITLDQTYTLSLVAQGSTYQMPLDGDLLLSAEDDTFTEGFVGIFTIVGPAELIINNIIISDQAAATASDDAAGASSSGLLGDLDAATTPQASSSGLFGNN